MKKSNSDVEQFAFMWSAMRFGYCKYPHVDNLKSYCNQLRQGIIQKNCGTRRDKPEHYISFEDVGTIINSIAIEILCLYLCGSLDELEKSGINNDIKSELEPERNCKNDKTKAVKYSTEELDNGLLDETWNMLRMGYQEVPDIGTVKANCIALQNAMIQFSEDKRNKKPEYFIRYGKIESLIQLVVLDAMCLFLSGVLDQHDDIFYGEIKYPPANDQQMTGK